MRKLLTEQNRKLKKKQLWKTRLKTKSRNVFQRKHQTSEAYFSVKKTFCAFLRKYLWGAWGRPNVFFKNRPKSLSLPRNCLWGLVLPPKNFRILHFFMLSNITLFWFAMLFGAFSLPVFLVSHAARHVELNLYLWIFDDYFFWRWRALDRPMTRSTGTINWTQLLRHLRLLLSNNLPHSARPLYKSTLYLQAFHP